MIWQLMFLLLAAEAALTVLLLIPLPIVIRRSFLSLYHRMANTAVFKYIVVTLFAIICMLFLDSWREYTNLHSQVHIVPTTGTIASVIAPSYARMFRAQRNEYISGICLFLLFVVWRLAQYDLVPRAKAEKQQNKKETELKEKEVEKEKGTIASLPAEAKETPKPTAETAAAAKKTQ